MGQPSDVLEEDPRLRAVAAAAARRRRGAARGRGGFFLGGGDVAPASPASCLDEWSADGRVVYRKPGASPESARAFQFSGVFGPEATQADVYAACAADVVAAAASGYNGTVVAYGQTGAGKTHTMRGVEAPGKALHADAGIVPRALRDLFAAQGAAARQASSSACRPHVPYRDSSSRACSASLRRRGRRSSALVPGGDAGGESRSTLEFAGRAARVAVRAAPAEVAVDYEALHGGGGGALEARADLALENERLTVEDDALHAKRSAVAASAAASGAGAVDAIEALHERWAETDLLETRHADALANAKRRAEERVAAYRSAADGPPPTATRRRPRRSVSHLETLERLNTTKRALADAEKRGAARVGELLAELQDLRDASEDLEAR
ncbi:hypothetical protein JL720_16232 [Aureococcus anophagefferens]|nr:hypothetical protein JL720_16232 [Aureococcus anophagefferens]